MKFATVKYSIITAALSSACLFSAAAYASPNEPVPEGIQAGGFVIHPGADLSIGADIANLEGRSTKDGLIDIGAHLRTSLLNDEKYAWNNNVNLKWRQFWGLEKTKEADGGINVQISTVADLFKESIFRLSPSVAYKYVSEPEDENFRMDFKNHNITAGTGITIQPGRGAIFSERLSYFFNGHLYQDNSSITNFTHKIESVTRWNFLPDTSMSLTVDFRVINYLEDIRGTSSLSGEEIQNSSSYPVRIKYGLQGLMLSRLSYDLGLGYAYVHYDNDLNEHMFIMNAKLKYDFMEFAGIFVQYQKDFDNSVYGNYYKFHNVSAGLDAVWFEHLQTVAEVGYGHFNFRSIQAPARKDDFVTAQAKIYYHFFPGLKLGVEYRLRYNKSDYVDADYNKHMITLNVGYEY